MYSKFLERLDARCTQLCNAVDSTTFLDDAKNVYGAIQEQVSTLPVFMNLLDDGPMGEPISSAGIRGYTFLARLAPNWRMGFRPESSSTGVGTAGNIGMKQATVSLKFAYCPIVITGQAENLTKGNERAFLQAKALESKFDMKDLISHINVVMVGAERGGELAEVASAASGSFVCKAQDTSPNLPGAAYLRAGMYVDTGTVGGSALSVSDNLIASINYSTRTVTLTDAETAVADQAVTLAGEHALTTGTFPYTCEGLVSLVMDTGSRQGLNPATAGQEAWSSFLQDVGGVDISSQLIMEQIQFTKNRSGEDPDLGFFPSAQINKLTAIATQTLRFDVPAAGSMGKKANDLGFTSYTYGGRTIIEDKDARPDRTYWGKASMMRKFINVPLSLAQDEAGTWTRIYTTTGIADAVAGLLRTYLQLGILQRSSWSVYKNFTVPAAFQNVPPTI